MLTPASFATGISEYSLSMEEGFEEFLKYIPKYIEDGAPIALNLSGFFLARDTKNYLSGYCRMFEDNSNENHCLCGHVRNCTFINADGKILPCIPFSDATNVHEHFQNIHESRLKDVLSDSYNMNIISATMRDYLEHNSYCRECEFKYRCAGGCRGRAVAKSLTNDIWARDNVFCTFYHKGFYKRLLDLMESLNVKKIVV